jgi:cellulose synthase/poly-beta-1,6-N-acetylglucosamine synthase-like glycosyltransferase
MSSEVIGNFVVYIGILFQFFLWGIFLYYFVIGVFGWVKRKEQKGEDFPIKNRFAIIISAHNEEAVIAGAVKSLKSVNYPQNMYDIFVVADNCIDNTAQIARENGAKVYERKHLLKKGKGFALEWMFEKLFGMEISYDAICVLDADNLVSKDFFLEMNKKLILGHKVIQGYLDTKNPHDSWISGNYAIAYWISNRLFQLPRHYLGLNCALGGTGFVMDTSVLKEIGWGATCLTEDLEFSIKLVLRGMRVSWAHDAIVYDEKPLKMVQSWKQRKRWMQGHFDCARKYLKSLLVMSIKEKSKVAFDSALYLIQPMIIVANGLAAVYAVFNLLFLTNFQEIFLRDMLLFTMLVVFVTYVNVIFVVVEGKFTKKNRPLFLVVSHLQFVMDSRDHRRVFGQKQDGVGSYDSYQSHRYRRD